MRALAAGLIVALALPAQLAKPKKPQDLKGFSTPDEPANLKPAASTFKDAKYKLTLRIPAGWDVEHRDGVLSNLGKDVRTAKSTMNVRGVAAINYNPYPPTTFSGALFYYSVVPGATAAACTALATTGHLKPKPEIKVQGLTFQHGQDQHGGMCTESRDDVFTTMQGKTCLRFDLVVNTFCPQSSGAAELNGPQLADINTRLGNILGSLQFSK